MTPNSIALLALGLALLVGAGVALVAWNSRSRWIQFGRRLEEERRILVEVQDRLKLHDDEGQGFRNLLDDLVASLEQGNAQLTHDIELTLERVRVMERDRAQLGRDLANAENAISSQEARIDALENPKGSRTTTLPRGPKPEMDLSILLDSLVEPKVGNDQVVESNDSKGGGSIASNG